MMKKNYTNPEISIFKFDNEDILTTSSATAPASQINDIEASAVLESQDISVFD